LDAEAIAMKFQAKIIGPGGSCVDTRCFVSTCDEEAMRIAVKFVPSLDVELWRQDQLIVVLPSTIGRQNASSNVAE
jgi:hypothetical protein